MNTTPEQILDIEDALIAQLPGRICHMTRNGTNTPDLDALASESWLFNQPKENIDAIRARLDPSLNSFLDSIYDPTPGFFYRVSRLRMGLADQSSPLEDNDFEDKSGSHCLGGLYDQLSHRASFPLTIENSESIEPVAEHWDMWFPLETILTQRIHMLRMGKITADPRNERDLSNEEANARHQVGLRCWHPYCAAQIDSTVPAMDRYTDAIESHMQSLLQISREAPLSTNAELDAALVPKECFIRSFLARVRTRFKLIAPGLEVPHDKEAFTARQMFNAQSIRIRF
ncbi:hypothetical protein PENFLA_c032G08784 [Penicillium flavigenum]|uniref:Uncharacterized protein n=1 Tax=Penicillium flavigenum TaxID=254877 RepID=A0A1V6SND6_9EURO|nr:hypothetical protein PENFLA_c032G08784 [Penicillium flavigenum]